MKDFQDFDSTFVVGCLPVLCCCVFDLLGDKTNTGLVTSDKRIPRDDDDGLDSTTTASNSQNLTDHPVPDMWYACHVDDA